eukprot:6185067-Pleurochrysis_carterae.AAC.3
MSSSTRLPSISITLSLLAVSPLLRYQLSNINCNILNRGPDCVLTPDAQNASRFAARHDGRQGGGQRREGLDPSIASLTPSRFV